MRKRLKYFNEVLRPDLSNLINSTIRDSIQSLRGSIRHEYLKKLCFSKYNGETTCSPDVRYERAVTKWRSTEMLNDATNSRLENIDPANQIWPGLRVERFVHKVREIIVGIVGDSFPESVLYGDFSGGASTSLRRNHAQSAHKFLGKRHVTADCLPLAEAAISSHPLWLEAYTSGDLSLEVVKGNVLFTVPKNSEIDRCAAKEPDLNMYLQRGVGNYFRDCLRAIGINLNDQSQNRRWAWRGSLPASDPSSVSVATVDLSAASDSVTCSLVDLLLPDLMSSWMFSIRSPYTLVDGEWHENNMFSSMGNGFTFELESLLFYAITKAVCYFGGHRGPISVYGDDIIVPVSAYPQLEIALSWCGFSVNPDKSFHEGPFRESCGGHYIDGIDVTPFYVRKDVRTLTDLIQILNQIRLWSRRGMHNHRTFLPSFDGGSGSLLCVLDELWQELAKYVPVRFHGGHDYGSRTQLVSPVLPRMRLAYVTRSEHLGYGAYLQWHLRVRDRTLEEDFIVQNAETIVSTPNLRVRGAAKHQWVHNWCYPFEWH